jgi:hypothetical protein
MPQQPADRDFAPFPDPFPEDSIFSPITSDDRKEWRKAKAKWEAEHGRPEDAPFS